jgi:hypothetical protein
MLIGEETLMWLQLEEIFSDVMSQLKKIGTHVSTFRIGIESQEKDSRTLT